MRWFHWFRLTGETRSDQTAFGRRLAVVHDVVAVHHGQVVVGLPT